ncbi:MAG TPA: cytochrome c [Flavobacteriaceae bacterium]|nr:cytochrome c [Flavobacteriaceae bacterium]
MKKFALTILLLSFLVSCGDSEKKKDSNAKPKTEKKEVKYDKVDGVAVDMDNKGVGPIESIDLPDEIDQDLAAKGKEIYDINCLACHKPEERFIGPAPKGVLDRRAPEWVMNMILNPERMVKEDPIAKQLLIEYNGSPMANQGITEDEARAILEYFRTL